MQDISKDFEVFEINFVDYFKRKYTLFEAF